MLDEKEILSYDDIDILESIHSDLDESLRDLFFYIKKIQGEVDLIKKHIKLE